jgi:zinc transporter 2
MAEWTTFQNCDENDDDDDDEHTFDHLQTKKNHQNNNGTSAQHMHGFCVRCKTMAKISPSKSAFLTDVDEVLGGQVPGMCSTQGCPGYSGHAPTERILKTFVHHHDDLDNDDSSDDVPLLFVTNNTQKTYHGRGSSPSSNGAEELGALDHCHTVVPHRNHAAKAKKKLMAASCLCLLFIVGEVIGGYLSGSLAIMSDAAHMFSDFASFLVSLFAIHLGSRKPTKKYTFGYYRAEALGALFTVTIIWFVTGVLLYLAISRLVSGDFQVNPNPMMIVASCAVLFNIILGLLLHGVPHSHGHSHGGGGGSGGHHGHSHIADESEAADDDVDSTTTKKSHQHLNLRAAMIHVLGDLIQSIGVLISSVIIKMWPEYKNADPVCTLLFSVIVFCTTVTILRDTVRILLESNPDPRDYDAIFNDLFNLDHVIKVHDLHIWSLTTDRIALTVHLAVDGSSGVRREKILQNAIKMLRNKYQIQKTTVQIEDYKASIMNDCEQCQFIP